MMWSHRNVTISAFIVLVLLASSVGGYYWYTRDSDDNWTIEDLRDELEAQDEYQFDSSLAGETKTVKGEVTDISSNTTDIGELYFVELDDVSAVSLIYWDEVPHEVGDSISEEIEISEFFYNDETVISSKQVGSPLIPTQAIRNVNNASNEMSGLHFDVSEKEDDTLKVEIVKGDWDEVDGDVNLDLDNTSAKLYRGGSDPEEDQSALHDHSLLDDNEMIDEIEDLSTDSSENGVITFHDANENGVLETEDYFLVEGLERPDGEPKAELYTYHLTLHHEEESGPYGPDSPWTSYIIYNSEGLLHLDL